MTGQPPPATTLLAELASLAHCGRAEGYACITARREHGASSVEIPQPQFAILLEGRKQVRTAHQSLEYAPGDILLVTQRCRIDVVNTPDPRTGRYLSAIVPLCAEALAAAWKIEDPRMIAFLQEIVAKPGALRGATFALEVAHMLAVAQGVKVNLQHLKKAWAQNSARVMS